jgi:hypothetical protein
MEFVLEPRIYHLEFITCRISGLEHQSSFIVLKILITDEYITDEDFISYYLSYLEIPVEIFLPSFRYKIFLGTKFLGFNTFPTSAWRRPCILKNWLPKPR